MPSTEMRNSTERIGLEELRKIKIGFGHAHFDMSDRQQSEDSM